MPSLYYQLPYMYNCKHLLNIYLSISGNCKNTITSPQPTFLSRRFGLYQRPSSEESDKSTRWIKEAVHIQKEGRQSLNRDEGATR